METLNDILQEVEKSKTIKFIEPNQETAPEIEPDEFFLLTKQVSFPYKYLVMENCGDIEKAKCWCIFDEKLEALYTIEALNTFRRVSIPRLIRSLKEPSYHDGYKTAMTEVAKKLRLMKEDMEKLSSEANNKIWEMAYILECKECDSGIVNGTSRADDMHYCPVCFGSALIVPDYDNEAQAMKDKEKREQVEREKNERTNTTI